jgi:hypothetical protein
MHEVYTSIVYITVLLVLCAASVLSAVRNYNASTYLHNAQCTTYTVLLWLSRVNTCRTLYEKHLLLLSETVVAHFTLYNTAICCNAGVTLQ